MAIALLFVFPLMIGWCAFTTRGRVRLQLTAVAALAGVHVALAFAAERVSGRFEYAGNTDLGVALVLVVPWVAVLLVFWGLREALSNEGKGSWVPSAAIPIIYWATLLVSLVAAINLGWVVR